MTGLTDAEPLDCGGSVAWKVIDTEEFRTWFAGIQGKERNRLIAAIECLERDGPNLRRPLSGEIVSSRHKNMKELIPPSSNIRVLYAFDPKQNALLLIAGDKTNNWTTFYKKFVPIADRLFDEHLAKMGKG